MIPSVHVVRLASVEHEDDAVTRSGERACAIEELPAGVSLGKIETRARGPATDAPRFYNKKEDGGHGGKRGQKQGWQGTRGRIISPRRAFLLQSRPESFRGESA